MGDKMLSRLEFMIDSAIIRLREVQKFELIIQQNPQEFFAPKQGMKKKYPNTKKQFEQAYFECVMWIAVGTEWFEQNTPHLLKTTNDSENEKCETCNRKKVVRHKRKDINDEYFYLLGIKKIFNCFKHNMKLTTLDKIHHELLFTLVDEETQDKKKVNIQKVLWLDIKDISDQKGIRYTLQDESYVKNFANQNIIDTLLNAHTILSSLYQHLLKTNSQMAIESHK